MKIKSQRDLWSGLLFVVVGVVFAVGATAWASRSTVFPGRIRCFLMVSSSSRWYGDVFPSWKTPTRMVGESWEVIFPAISLRNANR